MLGKAEPRCSTGPGDEFGRFTNDGSICLKPTKICWERQPESASPGKLIEMGSADPAPVNSVRVRYQSSVGELRHPVDDGRFPG